MAVKKKARKARPVAKKAKAKPKTVSRKAKPKARPVSKKARPKAKPVSRKAKPKTRTVAKKVRPKTKSASKKARKGIKRQKKAAKRAATKPNLFESIKESNLFENLKEAISKKTAPKTVAVQAVEKHSNEDMALRLLSIYFTEVARYRLKRKLTLDEVINAYFYTLLRVERKGIEVDAAKKLLLKERM